MAPQDSGYRRWPGWIKVKVKVKIKIKIKVKTHGGTAPADDRGNSKQDHAHDPPQT